MNVLATIVACYGLLANSVAVVIGAMILAILLGTWESWRTVSRDLLMELASSCDCVSFTPP
jgi:uncharacterized membrane protein